VTVRLRHDRRAARHAAWRSRGVPRASRAPPCGAARSRRGNVL